jgi:hypothetical protein
MRYTAGLPVLASLLATLWAGPARSSPPTCSPMAIDADASVAARWPGLLDDVRTELVGRGDIDRCAHVTLTSRGVSVTVQVALPDGRSAARSISRREDVVPTLEALLLVPERRLAVEESATEPSEPEVPAANPVPAASSASSSPARGNALVRRLGSPGGDAEPQPTRAQGGGVRIDLSAAAGARIGDGQTGLGLSVLSFLDVSSWLAGFEGRVDRYNTLGAAPSGGPPDGHSGALEIAVLGGRRFWIDGSSALDLVAGPAVAIQGGSGSKGTVQATPAATGTTGTVSESSPGSAVTRLLAVARVSFSARSTLHTFVAVDGDVGASHSASTDFPDAPRLPTWTVGLSLGATVGTP